MAYSESEREFTFAKKSTYDKLTVTMHMSQQTYSSLYDDCLICDLIISV